MGNSFVEMSGLKMDAFSGRKIVSHDIPYEEVFHILIFWAIDI